MDAPQVVVFDLDGTLAESKRPLTHETAELLARLLAHTKIAVISGGALPQFLKQVVLQLPQDAPLGNLFLLPTSGAALYEYHPAGGWHKVYEERITENDAAGIEVAMKEGADASGVIDPREPLWGPQIEYRGGQVTFSAHGQGAPFAIKKDWDPDHKKRLALQKEIQRRLPKGFQAAMGGANSVDVTKEGIDKAYGLRKLCARLGVREEDALYVGDELVAHGNDEAVFKTRARTRAVSSPAETASLIGELVQT